MKITAWITIIAADSSDKQLCGKKEYLHVVLIYLANIKWQSKITPRFLVDDSDISSSPTAWVSEISFFYHYILVDHPCSYIRIPSMALELFWKFSIYMNIKC